MASTPENQEGQSLVHFITDCRLVAELDDATFGAALVAVDRLTGFVGQKHLNLALRDVIAGAEQREAFVRFLSNLVAMRRQADQSPEELSDMLVARVNTLSRKIGDTAVETLIKRIPALAQPRAGIELQMKAEGLYYASSARFNHVNVFCDLRPVFDDERQRVEGIFPRITLELVYDYPHKPDYESMEVVLTEQDLAQLSDTANRARYKLAALKKLLVSKDIVVPDITEAPESEDGHG